MRSRVIGITLAFWVLASTLTFATTINLVPDGLPIDGPPDLYQAYPSTVDIAADGTVQIHLFFNYPTNSLEGYPDPSLGLNIRPADLLFISNGNRYGIPIAGPLTFDPSNPHDALTAGRLYSATDFVLAYQALGISDDTSLIHRPEAAVWLGGTINQLAILHEDVKNHPGPGLLPVFEVDITGSVAGTAFLADLNAHGAQAFFGSADCANGYLIGEGDPNTQVPEPASLVLFATGLLGLSGAIHRRKFRS